MNAKKIIEKLENTKGNFWEWVLTIFALYSLRALLDLLLEAKIYPSFSLNFFITAYVSNLLWYSSLFLAIVTILFLVTGKDIKKITKACFVFWVVILLVPITDFVCSGGKGFVLSYISNRYFWEEFFSFFGLFGSYHITYGQTLALCLGFFLVIFYSFMKTESFAKSFLAALAYYCIIYFYASLPMFWAKPKMILFVLTVLQLILWHWFYDEKELKYLIKNSHWLRVLHYTGLTIIGGLLSAACFYKEVNVEMLYFATFSSLFAFQSALIVNNIYDGKKLAYPKNHYKNIGIILTALAIIPSLFINAAFLLLLITYLLLGFIYSAPPIRFKRFGYWNNLLIGFESALMFAAGFVSQNPDIKLLPLNIFLTVFVIFSIAGNIKDLKDYREDKREGIKTLPVLLGRKRSVKVLALLTSICFPLSVAMLGLWNLLLIRVIFGLVNGLLLLKFKTEKTVFVCYFGFLFVLGCWLLLF